MAVRGKFFHVFIAQPPARGLIEPILSDLDSASLKQRFIKPYERGKTIKVENDIVDLSTVSSVAIVQTELPRSEVEVLIEKAHWEHLEDLNRSPHFAHFALPPSWSPEDASEYGVDVTSKYLKGAPGSANGRLGWLQNPWVVTLGAGLILLLLGLAFGV